MKLIWLPGEACKDRLTKREVLAYGLIKYAGFFLLFLYLLLVFVFELLQPTSWHIVAVLIVSVPIWIFGLALQTDTRVVHWVSWLRSTQKREGTE